MKQWHTLSLQIRGREELHLRWQESEGILVASELNAIGDLRFLKKIAEWRAHLNGAITKIPIPDGSSSAEMLLRELILKLRKEWNPPYKEEEICHCRAVLLKTVDEAIVAGAHHCARISEWTSASTSCGTCQPDVAAHLDYRLRRAA